ncbi:MAG: sulfatase-like hydrolase/transferase [Bacteroidota bacterium]
MKFLLAALLLSLGLSACQTSSPQDLPPPNIVWLVAEDISPALGCYSDEFAYSPNIDQLAAQGIVYTRAYATAPICAPSRSCLNSGLYASSLGTQHLRSEVAFPAGIKTLPTLLKENGYFTSNRNKSDYNYDPEGLWEHWSGSLAPWRARQDQRPFYSFINVGPSHEGSVNQLHRYEQTAQQLTGPERHDPAQVSLPPYYPDTEECRAVWAHYYDMVSLMDREVGQVMDSLQADGLLDNTIVFFFGDHGFGMPRYKRWLYHTGLHIPLVVSVPERYQHFFPQTAGTKRDELVSFVQFVPSVLSLAGCELPDWLEGTPFLGEEKKKAQTYVFGARDRADDMYEMSRAVLDERYLYIRHYMPHLPPIQSGFIYSDVKHAFRALREARSQNLLNEVQQRFWQRKPIEELYDLQNDPQELQNLAEIPEMQAIKARLQDTLRGWMLAHRDLGLVPEAEYMMASAGTSPYDWAREQEIDFAEILAAAEQVGRTKDPEILRPYLQHPQSSARYWGIMAWLNAQLAVDELLALLNDQSAAVQIMAAEAILRQKDSPQALAVLERWVQNQQPWPALQAARAIQLVGERARPLIPVMYQVLETNLGEPDAKRKYKDFNFAAFTSWALEWALQELGEEIQVN